MKTKTTKNSPVKSPSVKKNQGPKTRGGNNPKKPGTDPDQTPTREIQKQPVAKPGKNNK